MFLINISVIFSNNISVIFSINISVMFLQILSPDASLEQLLQKDFTEDEFSRKYLKIKSKFITDGQVAFQIYTVVS